MLGDDFHRSPIWQQSMAVVRRCDRLADRFPDSDKTELGEHLRKAAVELPPRLAAAFAELDDAHFAEHLDELHGTLQQLDAVLVMAADLRRLPGWRVRKARRACVKLADLLAAERPAAA